MLLPNEFQFSQNNLQDYVDCQRRFQLKYLQKLEWPAPRAEPILEAEQQMLLGQRFHEIIHQYFIGIPGIDLEDFIDDSILKIWWNNFQNRFKGALPGRLFPEHMITCKIEGVNFIAKYDLIQIKPDSTVIIYDWKTTRIPPKLEFIAKRLQSRVYPSLFMKGAASFFKDEYFSNANLQMVYWYPNFPELSLTIPSNDKKLEEDLIFIRDLINRIKAKAQNDFLLTDEVKRCNFCNYRSLCNRGVAAGTVSEMENDEQSEDADLTEFNFENLQEIAY
jgi:hypothetical protein